MSEQTINMAKRYEHVLDLVYAQPWAITPEYLAIIQSIVARRIHGTDLSPAEIEAAIHPRRTGQLNQVGAVAVLPLYGPIAQRMNLMSEVSGGVSTEQFGAMFTQAVGDPNVASIVIDIDSPGGSVFGVQELWNTIMSHRGEKPVTAVANSMAASAAYWIATAADSISVTPGGTVGSIGVILQHTDISQAMDHEGVRTTLITAGKKKGAGNPFEPLSDETRADLQGQVDTYYRMFVGAVAQGRGVSTAQVRGGFGEGDVVLAQEAKTLGMVDRVETLDQAIGRMTGRSQRKGARTSSTATFTVVDWVAENFMTDDVIPEPVPAPEPDPEPVPTDSRILVARRRAFE